jgi:hypothetical protein
MDLSLCCFSDDAFHASRLRVVHFDAVAQVCAVFSQVRIFKDGSVGFFGDSL